MLRSVFGDRKCTVRNYNNDYFSTHIVTPNLPTMSPENPLVPHPKLTASCFRGPGLGNLQVPQILSGPIPMLALISQPCGVQAEPFPGNSIFISSSSTQEGGAALSFPALVVSSLGASSGSWPDVTLVETRLPWLLRWALTLFPARPAIRYLSPNSHGFLSFLFPDVEGSETFWQKFVSHLHLCHFLRDVATFYRSSHHNFSLSFCFGSGAN